MVSAGLDVVRINFSHGTRAQRRVEMRAGGRGGRSLRRRARPTWRARRSASRAFATGQVQLAEGAPFALDTALGSSRQHDDGRHRLQESARGRASSGDMLLLNDGQIVLQVEKVAGTRISTVVRSGGELSQQQGHQSPGRRNIRASAHGQGPRGHPACGRTRRRLSRGLLRARCRRHAPGAVGAARAARRGARGREDRARRGDRAIWRASSPSPTSSWSRAAISASRWVTPS